MSLYKDDATSENFLLISIFLWALSLCFNSKYGFNVGGVFCNSDAETLLFFVASGVRRFFFSAGGVRGFVLPSALLVVVVGF
jgi:hypothetical protein